MIPVGQMGWTAAGPVDRVERSATSDNLIYDKSPTRLGEDPKNVAAAQYPLGVPCLLYGDHFFDHIL
jgi:hypothetical protein